jgi:anthranilate phosphoribosyltransferase
VLETFTKQLASSQALSDEQIAIAVEQLVDEAIAAPTKATFLTQLAAKGETTAEIAAFARALRGKSIQPPIETGWREAHSILDVCGTGGDRLNTFNISTTVALVCAAAGIAVAKHGNRAITSQAGSADVLEALGIRIDLPPSEAAQSLQERNFAFFFAPNYHPAFKHIGAARKLCAERGQRTIFNFLGPLLNPARPCSQLIGVPRPELCEPIARVVQTLGLRRGMVVSGKVATQSVEESWLDELSTLGDNTVAEFYHERGFTTSVLGLEHFPLQSATLADLLGGDRTTNAEIVQRLLEGKERGPKRDAVLLNSAAALFVAGQTRTLADGWETASTLIDSGEAARKLAELRRA